MLSKEQKRKVRERVYKRYVRLAEKLGKDFREVSINGKTYKEALEFELRKEEDLVKKGEESKLRRSRTVEHEVVTRRKRKDPLDWLANPCDKRGSHAPECQCNKCMGGFGDPNLIGRIPESDEERAERKEFEKEVNEQLERACTSGICPVCKSSVCRCGDD